MATIKNEHKRLRAERPLSPTRQSRMEEKSDLQKNNDRLVCYIGRCRYLEGENERLTKLVECMAENPSREKSEVNKTIEAQCEHLWKALEVAQKENDECCLEKNRLQDEASKLRDSMNKKQSELDVALAELKALKEQLDVAQEARVMAESEVKSARDQLDFNKKVCDVELNDTVRRLTQEMRDMDNQLAKKYESKSHQAIRELRYQYEVQLAANRAEIEKIFQDKLKNLQNQSVQFNDAIKEIANARKQIADSNARIRELEQLLSNCTNRSAELKAEIDKQIHLREQDNAEIRRLRDEMDRQLQEYQDLMDVKVSLDMEIAAYNKLLTSEEDRMNISNMCDGFSHPNGSIVATNERVRRMVMESHTPDPNNPRSPDSNNLQRSEPRNPCIPKDCRPTETNGSKLCLIM